MADLAPLLRLTRSRGRDLMLVVWEHFGLVVDEALTVRLIRSAPPAPLLGRSRPACLPLRALADILALV